MVVLHRAHDDVADDDVNADRRDVRDNDHGGCHGL